MPVIGDRPTVTIDRILLATDFSATAERAAGYARGLAQHFGSAVDIANVVDKSVVATWKEAEFGLNLPERERTSEENLERIREDFEVAGVRTELHCIEGRNPAASLLMLADDSQMGLIVTGTQCKPDLERMLFGSTAEGLIRHALCPVLTIGPNVPPAGNGPITFQRVLYATDFSPEAANAAVYALTFAEESGATLYLCHILEGDVPAETQAELKAAFTARLQRLVPGSAIDWCTPEYLLECGEKQEAILKLAHEVDADLMVLGARTPVSWLRHSRRGLIPSLLSGTTCPILSVCTTPGRRCSCQQEPKIDS